MKMCKKLKIKVTRRTKSGKRVPKTLKQLRKEIKTKKKNLKSKKVLFIQKANKESRRKGTVGTFGRWCKRNKLSDSSGRVTMRCIKKALKSGDTTLIRRANYARNIGGYVGAKHTKRTAIGLKRTAFGLKRTAFGLKRTAFGLIDQLRYNKFAEMNWEIPDSEFTKRSLRMVRRKCEDGESGILFNKIIPGMYVNLGNKKCLSVQEILQMSDTNKFLKNAKGQYIDPFTRKPLTRAHIFKINEILRAAGKPDLSTLVIKKIEEFDNDLYYYYQYLTGLLTNNNLSIYDQIAIIDLIAPLEDSGFQINEQDIHTRWQFVQGRIYIMTPSGWMLPENMGQDEWMNAGISEEEYNQMNEPEEEQESLAPRRLFEFGRKRY